MNDQVGPIFIVGVPRSGTTLMRLILNAHSSVSLGPETHFFKQVWQNRSEYGDLSINDNLLKLWREYSVTKSFDDFSFKDKNHIEKKVLSTVKTYSEFLSVLLNSYSNLHGKNIWGEKTPEHLFYVEQIVDWYPNAKIIHVIRDPRAVCASLRKVPWSSNDVISNARVWNRYLEFADKLSSTKYKNSIIDIRYEDLVLETESVLEKVCKFIGIQYEKNMLNFYVDSDKFVEKSEPWKNNVLNPLNKDSIYKWKSEINDIQANEIKIKSKRYMLDYGYLNKEDVSIGFHDLISSLYVHVKWIFRRLLFHFQI